MVFEHHGRKPYEFVWFLVLLNIFPQQKYAGLPSQAFRTLRRGPKGGHCGGATAPPKPPGNLDFPMVVAMMGFGGSNTVEEKY